MEFGLTKEQYSLFQREALCGSISVGGTCRNNCIFCSTRVSEKCMRQPSFHNYISWEDFNSVLPIVGIEKKDYPNEIQIGNGIGVLTCEPFYHPHYVDFIKALHNFNKNFWLHTGTVGKWIHPEWFDIFKQNNMHFYVSINSFNKDMRSKLMHSKDDYNGLVLFLKECREIMYKTSMIYHGELDVFKKDLDTLLSIDPGYVNIPFRFWLPEYSQYSSQEAKNLYSYAKKTWNEANIYLKSIMKYPQPAVTQLDDSFPEEIFPEVKELRKNFDSRMENLIQNIKYRKINIKDVGFLLAESVFNYSIKYKNYGINRILVKNINTGGSYKVAPLLSKDDIVNAIESNEKYKYYVLPQDVFKYLNNDLLGYHPNQYGDYHFILV